MKLHNIASTISTIAAAIALSLPLALHAQGRHDEKPHDMMKSSPTASEQAGGTGGRHDEGPTSHGKKKAHAKTAAAKTEDAQKDGPKSRDPSTTK